MRILLFQDLNLANDSVKHFWKKAELNAEQIEKGMERLKLRELCNLAT